MRCQYANWNRTPLVPQNRAPPAAAGTHAHCLPSRGWIAQDSEELAITADARCHAPEVARDLKTGVRQLEGTAAIAAAGVLGSDQLLEDIEVRAFEPRAEQAPKRAAAAASAQITGRRRGRTRFVARGWAPCLLSSLWELQKEERRRVKERGKRVEETQRGALATRKPTSMPA